MPTYQYTCTECGEQVEAVQKFTDDPLSVCDACGGRLRKVFFPAGIVFKGSGFYRTDSRNGSKSTAAKDKATSDSGSSASTGSTDGKSADKPAAKAESGSSSGSGSSGSGSSGEKAA